MVIHMGAENSHMLASPFPLLSEKQNEHAFSVLDHSIGSSEARRGKTVQENLKSAVEELVRGLVFLDGIKQQYPRRVTFFGSARPNLRPSVYSDAENLAEMLVRGTGSAIVSGGGPGIMKAVTNGAKNAGGVSVGFKVDIPTEKETSDTTHAMQFDNFFIRRFLLTNSGNAYVFYPGGFGTLDELTEVLVLIQQGWADRIPVILIGKEYWSSLQKWIEDELFKKNGTIVGKDTEIVTIVDSAEKAYEIIQKHFEEHHPSG